MTIEVTRKVAHLPAPVAHRFEVVETASVAELVARAMPGADAAVLARTRVWICSGGQSSEVRRGLWPRVRPHPGAQVVIAEQPGVGAAVSAFASLVGQAQFSLGVLGFGALSKPLGYALVIGGIVAVGSAINSLVPQLPTPGDRRSANETYRITGWRNEILAGEPVPLPLGEIRVAPMFAAQPYTEVVGDAQYIRAAFCFGYGQLDISDLRIGDTPLSEFSDVEIELREGTSLDAPLTLTPNQVIEEAINVDIPGNGGAETYVASTGQNASGANLIFYWPSGLVGFKDDGRTTGASVRLRLRYREAGTETWRVHDGVGDASGEVVFRGATLDAFFRDVRFDFPSRGRWEIEVTRTDTGKDGTKRQGRTSLAAVQTLRPEYPIAMTKPLALAAVRIRATQQLDGVLDSFNALVKRHVKDWDGSTWAAALSRNPAAHYMHALQGAHHPFPVPDDKINWPEIEDWHAFCTAKGLHYDADIRGRRRLGDLLAEIAAAGRASPRFDGARWGVVIDRPQKDFVDHIGPRTATDIEIEPAYIDPPDGVRVRFLDRTQDYREAERIVPWPGHVGPIDRIEEWALPGKTDPAELAREIYRRMLEAIHRAEICTAIQDGAARVAVRGDAVLLAHEALAESNVHARVTDRQGTRVYLDEIVSIDPARRYVIRWQDYDADDVVGVARQVEVRALAGERRRIEPLDQYAPLPSVGDHLLFGELGQETIACRVLGVEPAENMAQRLIMTNDAPEIETLADAFVPAAWDPAVGDPLEVDPSAPVAPVITDVATVAPEASYGATTRLVAVTINRIASELAFISRFEVQHRLQGSGSWTLLSVTAAGSTVSIAGYELGDVVELRPRAISSAGIVSAYGDIETFTVGSDEAPAPSIPDLATISGTAGLGHVAFQIAHSDPNTVSIEVFRTPAGNAFDAETDSIGRVTVPASQTQSYIDGDASRVNLAPTGQWTAQGVGWSASGGGFDHTPGTAGPLEKAPAPALAAGQTVRWSFVQSGRTAGTTRFGIEGGAGNAYDVTQTGNGHVLGSIAAPAAPGDLVIEADADFDGSVSEIVAYVETNACAPQGAREYRFAAWNIDDVASAVSSPITLTIV